MFIGLIVLIGIGLLLYPTVSNWYNDVHRTRAIADYENAMSELSAVDLESLFEEARVYNQSLAGKINRFMPSDTELDAYNQILDITGTGIMGYIEIPKISVKLPVYHTVDETVLQIAAGHMPGTSFPIGEAGTHSVMSGHRGLPSAKLFTHLDKLENGDVFHVHILDKTMSYEVYDIDIVLPEEMDSLALDPERDLVTLVTCTPYGVNSHRILVHGERTECIEFVTDTESDENANVSDMNESGDFDPVMIAMFVILIIIGLFLISLFVKQSRKEKGG